MKNKKNDRSRHDRFHYSVYVALIISNLTTISLAALFTNDFSSGLAYFEQIRQESLLSIGATPAFARSELVYTDSGRNRKIMAFDGGGAGGGTSVKPMVSLNPLHQDRDGSGHISISLAASDEQGDPVMLKSEFIRDSLCSDVSGQSWLRMNQFTDPISASYNDTGGSPNIDTAQADGFYIGPGTNRHITTNLGQNTIVYTWNLIDQEGQTTTTNYCFRPTLKETSSANGNTSDPVYGPVVTDTINPTAPGNLTRGCVTDTIAKVNFGASSSDINFDRYRIYRKQGIAGVTENDTSITLPYSATYSGAEDYLLAGLTPNTDYVVNIWAYDTYCQTGFSSCLYNKNKAANELHFKTIANPVPSQTMNCPNDGGSSTNGFGSQVVVWAEEINGYKDIYMCNRAKDGNKGGCKPTDQKTLISKSDIGNITNDDFPKIIGWNIVWQRDTGVFPFFGRQDLYSCNYYNHPNGCNASEEIRMTDSPAFDDRDLSTFSSWFYVWESDIGGGALLEICDHYYDQPGRNPRSCTHPEQITYLTPNSYGAYNPVPSGSLLYFTEDVDIDPTSGIELQPQVRMCDWYDQNLYGHCMSENFLTIAPLDSSIATADEVKPSSSWWRTVWNDVSVGNGYFDKLYFCSLYKNGQQDGCLETDQKRIVESGVRMKNAQIGYEHIFWTEEEPDGQLTYVTCHFKEDESVDDCYDGGARTVLKQNMDPDSNPKFISSGVSMDITWQEPAEAGEWRVMYERFLY